MAELRREPFTHDDRTYHVVILDAGSKGIVGVAEHGGRPVRATRLRVARRPNGLAPAQVDGLIDDVKRRLLGVRPRRGRAAR